VLDEIEMFVQVASCGSFAAAARRRGVPKSTLSRAVDRLEDTLKTRLFERGTRKVTLTEAGQTFLAQAGPHVAALRDAAQLVGERSGRLSGTLRLTAPIDVGDAFLGDLLVRFAARYPEVHLDVDVSWQRHDLVADGFDVGLRAATRIEDPSLVARPVLRTEAQLFASPAYIARRGMPRTPADLADHACVLLRPEDGREEWVLSGPDGEHRVVVTGRFGARDYSVIRSALCAGGGIGLMPVLGSPRDVVEGKLVRVLPEYARPSGTLYVVYPAARHVPRKVIAFRDFVIESLGEPSVRDRPR
jgi:DNA-binding transcriptional LysR family regulator